MLDSINGLTLNLLETTFFGVQNAKIVPFYATLLWSSLDNVTKLYINNLWFINFNTWFHNM